MENGVSSFNHFIHELSVDSDNSSIDNSSGEEDNDDDIYPASPLSHSSRASRASSFSKYDRRRTGWIAYIFLWLLFPIKFLLGIPSRVHRLSYWDSKSSSTPGSDNSSNLRSFKRVQTLKDHIVHRTTDRRRGVVEDLHLAIEIFIEAIFDVVHKVAHFLLSPSEAFKVLFRLCFSHNSQGKENHESESEASVPTSTLGENDPSPTERTTSFHQALNTDARTCQDVITELGYPYEAIRVITSDGYVLLLERIPRRDSRKAVYLQHGILDSSMGWVSNGVVGSPAFAAFDQGYDVFLGNFRGLVSREHIDKNISSRQYWRYSINEHGTEDIPAMIEKIHQVKTAELKLSQPGLEEETSEDQLYRLCAVSHSLGGAAMIMYVITQRIQEKPHRLSRLVLLSPAGFHDDSTFVFTVVERFFLLLAPLLEPLVPGFYIPTRFFRMLLNKLARDFHNYPAVGGLVQTLMSYIVGGDSSNWVGVLGLPHYNMNDMPGVSFHVALHLAQMKRSGRFRMYNYGSASVNMEIYGSPEPLDLGEYYEFIDIPVDLVAGRKDKVIRPSMVRKHYKLMRDSGVNVSYNEFEYAHLDFTFSHREELLAYVMSRLLLVEPTLTRQSSQKALKLKRKGHVRSGPKVDEVTMG
ncbi:AB-hydrolase lipase domain containing protein [Trema orientale]|uniref:AB-hydrolase lipase domain containing protein n=1 Tax=Trema orientale TaxID=63057 RepID=A0A2P5ELZ1_TREOI|nr:AB-hydrolase lipase domain containing protein [Trema orientale]